MSGTVSDCERDCEGLLMKPIVDQWGIGETKRDLIAGKEEVFILSG